MPVDSLFDHPYAVVDVETTGLSARQDAVAEIAVVRLEHGQPSLVLERLLDPGRPIPPFVTRLTGITTAMVRGQPTLEETLPEIERALAGAIVVAHNAVFDASFLQAAFARQERRWPARWLCTLRLARRLLPRHRSYRLPDLASALGLSVMPRHRAGADALATANLLKALLGLATEQGLDLAALLAAAGRPAWRRHAAGRIAAASTLPAGPGVYLLRDADGEVLYVGQSVRVRQRVATHLRGGAVQPPGGGQPRLHRLLPAVRDVAAIATESDLQGLLLESELIKHYQPPGNVLQRGERALPFVLIDLSDAFPRLEVTGQPAGSQALVFGPYRRAQDVAEAVEVLRGEIGLRACDGPLQPTAARACYLLDLRRCLGPCVGAVSPAAYRAATELAIATLSGQDTSVLERLARRRDALAAQLRFEEAARVRDRLFRLEWLIGSGQRPRRVDERNLVAVLPSQAAGERRLVFVRAGRLAHETRSPVPGQADLLAALLQRVFQAPTSGGVTRRIADEMWLIDRWLGRQRDARLVRVAQARPLDALEPLLAALAA